MESHLSEKLREKSDQYRSTKDKNKNSWNNDKTTALNNTLEKKRKAKLRNEFSLNLPGCPSINRSLTGLLNFTIKKGQWSKADITSTEFKM